MKDKCLPVIRKMFLTDFYVMGGVKEILKPERQWGKVTSEVLLTLYSVILLISLCNQ